MQCTPGRNWNRSTSIFKMIPAKNVCLDQEELIDLVNHILETDLKNQARMHSFKSSFDLLKAFSMIFDDRHSVIRVVIEINATIENRWSSVHQQIGQDTLVNYDVLIATVQDKVRRTVHIREKNGAPVINAEIHSTDLLLVLRMQGPG